MAPATPTAGKGGHLPAWLDIWQGCRMAESDSPKHVLITGASSGIGEALALAYAMPGALLSLTGRDAKRLGAVAAACESRGAKVRQAILDVTDAKATADWAIAADDAQPVDLLIANAGISGGTYGGPETAAQTRAVLAVNIDGVVNSVLPLIPHMLARGRGQIAIISSLAGHRGFPGAPAYCASKAAVKVWGEGLRAELAPRNVQVSVVMPGFVKSRMTDVNKFHMPFLMSAEKAAEIIRVGLARNRARIAFPFPTATFAWFIGLLSPAITDALLRRLPKKG
jgi:short-subunit dehydrogenase